jgi:antirestriction protein ArdC
MEELVAELSSAVLGVELGLPVDHLDHHASYLASWLKVLKADSRTVLTVGAKAEGGIVRAPAARPAGGHRCAGRRRCNRVSETIAA